MNYRLLTIMLSLIISHVSHGVIKGSYIPVGNAIEISTNLTYFQFSNDYSWLTLLSKTPFESNYRNRSIISSVATTNSNNESYTIYETQTLSTQISYSNELSVYKLENENYVLDYQTDHLNLGRTTHLLIDENYDQSSSSGWTTYAIDANTNNPNPVFLYYSEGESDYESGTVDYLLIKTNNVFGMDIYRAEQGGYGNNYYGDGYSYDYVYSLTLSNDTFFAAITAEDAWPVEVSKSISNVQLEESIISNVRLNFNQMDDVVTHIYDNDGIQFVQFYRKKIIPYLQLNQDNLILWGNTNRNHIIQRTFNLGDNWENYMMLSSVSNTTLSLSVPLDQSRVFYKVIEE